MAVGDTVSTVVADARSLLVDLLFSPASVRCAITTCAATAEQSFLKDPGCAVCVPKSRKRLFFYIYKYKYFLLCHNNCNFCFDATLCLHQNSLSLGFYCQQISRIPPSPSMPNNVMIYTLYTYIL